MATSIANTEYLGFGGPGGKWLYTEVTLDSAYLPGGETFTAADLGLQFMKAIFVAYNEDGYIFQISLNAAKTTATVKVYSNFSTATNSAGTPQEASIQDLSGVVLPLLIRGI